MSQENRDAYHDDFQASPELEESQTILESSDTEAPRRATWLLMLLLAVVAFLGHHYKPQAPVVYQAVSQTLPEIIYPEGELAQIFDLARPATLRIEARAPNLLLGRAGPIGIGTGFFISAEGLVLTAFHVVDRSNSSASLRENLEFVGVTADETEYALELIGFDAFLDLAILKTTTSLEVPYLPLAAASPRLGNDIIAIGNSQGDFLQGRVGQVSRLGVDRPQARFAEGTIELTAALGPGDSGGPVINSRGEVIGVVSYISFRPDAIGAESDSYVPPFLRGLVSPRTFAAFAVPVLSDSEVLAMLIAGESKDEPVIGFEAGLRPRIPSSYDPRAGNSPYLGPRPGVVVGRVAPGGPASEAGLRGIRVIEDRLEADVIVAVDDEATPDFYQLLELLYFKGVGETVTLTVQRGDALVTFDLELGAKRQVFN